MTRELSTSGRHVAAWIGSWCQKISAAFQKLKSLLLPAFSGWRNQWMSSEPRDLEWSTLVRPVSQQTLWDPEAVCVTARASQNVSFWCSAPNDQTWTAEWPEKAVVRSKVQQACPEAFLKATAERNGQMISVWWRDILSVWLQPPMLCVCGENEMLSMAFIVASHSQMVMAASPCEDVVVLWLGLEPS